jgi:hypothetical protein
MIRIWEGAGCGVRGPFLRQGHHDVSGAALALRFAPLSAETNFTPDIRRHSLHFYSTIVSPCSQLLRKSPHWVRAVASSGPSAWMSSRSPPMRRDFSGISLATVARRLFWWARLPNLIKILSRFYTSTLRRVVLLLECLLKDKTGLLRVLWNLFSRIKCPVLI